ncbi:hypothetical protein C5F63_18445 [Photobacterium damselae subsp. damselae]|uniref:hypothetical protein n=1 Tax=Photobacterium damselae TaxID=38293 RepID=UPI000D0737DC|nr:hypothetical protein [Photobacterium damselae]PSB83659.1 hypothetical protein C5F63_18445 [Photobacterium damselae subsp. damselae]
MIRNIFFGILTYMMSCFCHATASEVKMLNFPMVARITSDSLFYKISDMSIFPDNIELNYNNEQKTFDKVHLNLNVMTNILSTSKDNYSYNLTLSYGHSICTNFNKEVEEYKHPEISIIIDGNEKTLQEYIPLSLDFSSISTAKDGNQYLSDSRELFLMFSEPQPEKIIKDFEFCDGDFSLIAGLDL